ncbi:hypothetical protein CC86DRAFT_308292, partial [Ophiobolus disseminans]
PRPPAQLPVPGAKEIAVVPSAQDDVPRTPITPVTAEALILLHNLIKENARTLDEGSQRRLQRHINKEAKVRRSTRSVVLEKAKVISYEDLEEARAKRAAKEKTS